MGILDRLFGRRKERESWGVESRSQPGFGPPRNRPSGETADEQAVERYRYLLRTAPPETIEQAHAEAFAQLTPEQRRMVLQELTTVLPENERAASAQSADDPRTLARMATRAELRQPGTLERTFGGMQSPGFSMGGLMAGSFLTSFAGVLVGSMIAQSFFSDSGYDQGFTDGQDSAESSNDTGQDAADAGSDQQDSGWDTAGDTGGDFGDFSGDFGGDF